MSPLDHLTLRIETHLAAIYGEGDHSPLVGRLIDTMRLKEHFFEPVPFINHWSEKDVALITYGDSIVPTDGTPLKELASFVRERLGDSISIVHVLPYFPWTSDDGFAISDYNQVSSD